jgi:hypothetical protein
MNGHDSTRHSSAAPGPESASADGRRRTRRFSPKTKAVWIAGAGVASAAAILGGAGVATAATSPAAAPAAAPTACPSASASPAPTPSASNGAPHAAPADGGATGLITSTSSSGFTLQTWTGVNVTVDTSGSTKVSGGPAKDLAATGTSLLVFGLVDAESGATTITAADIEIQRHGDGGAAAGKADGVLPTVTGEAAPTTVVGVVPCDYTQGVGTLVSGDRALKAVEAAQAVYPGGVVDRVVQLSEGNYEVHNFAIQWPHHVFETTNFKVEGAND